MRSFLLAVALCYSANVLHAEESKNLLKPTNLLESWNFEQRDGGKGTVEATETGIKFTVTEVDDTNWHVQAFQWNLDLKEGKSYTLKFKAMSPESRGYSAVGTINEEDWHEIGLHEDLYTSKQLSEESITFTATDVVEKKNRIGFILGDEKGTLVIQDMTLTEN